MRFLTSVIFGTVIMFSLSYVWHGLILNDFNAVTISKVLFFPMLGMVYAGIAVLLTTLFTFVPFETHGTRNRLLIGGAVGFFIYLIAFVLGVSFSPPSETEHIALDFVWQMMEQTAGALIIDFIFHIYHRRAVMKSFES